MSTSVGQQLKQAREALGISLEDASRATHIKQNYLQELESDHPELLPSPANARGFLRLYASLLKIPPQPLLDIWDAPYKPEPLSEPPAPVENLPEQQDTTVKEVEAPQGDKASELSGAETPDDSTLATAVSSEKTEPVVEKEKKTTKEKPEAFNLFKSASAFLKKKSKSRSLAKQKKDLTPESTTQPEATAPTEVQPVAESEWHAEETQPQAEEGALTDEVSKEPTAPTTTATESSSVPRKSSAEYFAEIGAALREQRETLNLNLADIERFTHIKRPFLEAMESGQFNQIPSTVQGRGMLNSYAAFLSMDGDTVMGLFASALEAQRLERLPPSKPQPVISGGIRINIPEPLKKYMSTDMVFGGLIILFMFFFLLWGAVQVFSQRSPEPTSTPPSVSEVLNATQTLQTTILATPSLATTEEALSETGLPGVLPETQSPATPFATQIAAPLQLYVVAQQRAFMRVTVDGVITFDGRTAPEDVFTFSGQESIVLLTGNAAALEVYFNDEFLGKLGAVGEVISLTFTESGFTTPTPRPTVAPTQVTIPQATETP